MPERPDAVCPNRAGHKQVEVAFAEPADRTIHWHCNTPIPAGGVCHAEWVTPWRDATFTDQYLEGIATFTESLQAARRALRGALLELANAATEDADAALAVPPEALDLTYEGKLRKVERNRAGLDQAREDLRVWRIQRDMQLSRRDTSSSASRQHYIDTGNYLDAGEAVTT